ENPGRFTIDFVEASAKNDMQVAGMVMNQPARYPYFPEPGLPGNPSLKRRCVQNPPKPSLDSCGMREKEIMVPGTESNSGAIYEQSEMVANDQPAFCTDVYTVRST
ncbi:hypothetical protein, partial [Sphingobium sp. UBA5915]|uniref:hypothetical protein n=1 Tax=Sphingobium sp. UBA5915 TaxID=1947530 RepID=UPI0025DFFB2B